MRTIPIFTLLVALAFANQVVYETPAHATYATAAPQWGTVAPQWGTAVPQWGNVAPQWGTASPYVAAPQWTGAQAYEYVSAPTQYVSAPAVEYVTPRTYAAPVVQEYIAAPALARSTHAPSTVATSPAAWRGW